jgi:hypothetical protein
MTLVVSTKRGYFFLTIEKTNLFNDCVIKVKLIYIRIINNDLVSEFLKGINSNIFLFPHFDFYFCSRSLAC